MPVTIIPAANYYGYGGSGGSSADGHIHSNMATLNKLSADADGNLRFNGKILGEKTVETVINFTLTDIQVQQKFLSLPDDCDSSRAVTLSLNGVSFAQGDFWEVREDVINEADFIAWDSLGLEQFAQAGDKVIISYYKKN